MEYLNGQDCSLLLTATGECGVLGRAPGPKPSVGTPHIFTHSLF